MPAGNRIQVAPPGMRRPGVSPCTGHALVVMSDAPSGRSERLSVHLRGLWPVLVVSES